MLLVNLGFNLDFTINFKLNNHLNTKYLCGALFKRCRVLGSTFCFSLKIKLGFGFHVGLLPLPNTFVYCLLATSTP